MMVRILISASAGMILFLGSVYLAYTLLTDKFGPREKQLETAMKQVSPRITGETTMWKVWIGIRISHCMGLVLFDLSLCVRIPMGVAVAVAFLDWARIAVARWVHMVGAHLLVQKSFDRSLFSQAVLPRRTCWYVCIRMRGGLEGASLGCFASS